MRIIHCCLANFYIDNYGYQENMLPKQNKLDGHEVSIIASTESYSDGKLCYLSPRRYINEFGIPVIRVPYKKILTEFITRKIRCYEGVYEILEQEAPDVIMFHGTCAGELLNIVKYKINHRHVKLFADSHTDQYNSATNLISRNILHRFFYRTITRKAYRYLEKILCISQDTQDFMQKFYGIPKNKLEFYPLGGHLPDDQLYLKNRFKIRQLLNLNPDDILFLHSGKLDKQKRTEELLAAFLKVRFPKFKLAILGSIPKDRSSMLTAMMQRDSRVSYLGWKNPEELIEYLCATDMYLQPGSQSATMQNALCCRCAVMLYPYKSHTPYLMENGYFVKTVADMVSCFEKISEKPELLKKMSDKSYKIARDILDYRKLAARLYQ